MIAETLKMSSLKVIIKHGHSILLDPMTFKWKLNE